MPITEENVTMKDWEMATKLFCPYLRYLCGVWLAIDENPCYKHPECKGCNGSNKNDMVVVKKEGDLNAEE